MMGMGESGRSKGRPEPDVLVGAITMNLEFQQAMVTSVIEDGREQADRDGKRIAEGLAQVQIAERTNVMRQVAHFRPADDARTGLDQPCEGIWFIRTEA